MSDQSTSQKETSNSEPSNITQQDTVDSQGSNPNPSSEEKYQNTLNEDKPSPLKTESLNEILVDSENIALPPVDSEAKHSTKVKSSQAITLNLFNRSAQLDQYILKDLSSMLANKSLLKQEESDYYQDLNIFDQEWEFPFNKCHYEYSQMLSKTEEENELKMQNDLLKRSLVDIQVQIRTLADYFLKVDRERIFFRNKLIRFLQGKLSKSLVESQSLKTFTEKFFSENGKDYESELKRLKKENKESNRLFVNLKNRNVGLEKDINQLKRQLKKNKDQLKKFMFQKGKPNDQSISLTTTNSGTGMFSGDNSYQSKEYKKFNNKFQNTQVNKQYKTRNTAPNEMMIRSQKMQDNKRPKGSLNIKHGEYYTDTNMVDNNINEFIQSSGGLFAGEGGHILSRRRATDNINGQHYGDILDSGYGIERKVQQNQFLDETDMYIEHDMNKKTRKSELMGSARRGQGLKAKLSNNRSSRFLNTQKRPSKNTGQFQINNPFLNKVFIFIFINFKNEEANQKSR